MAVQFDATRARARGEAIGDSIPVHVVIPTSRPWVPLRILALGAKAAQPIDADVFLLNDRTPAMLPVPRGVPELGPAARGLNVQVSEPASAGLMTDLRSDQGMRWLPKSGMWLTYLQVRARASQLRYDLAIDASGRARPSPVDAGLAQPGDTSVPASGNSLWGLWLAAGLATIVFGVAMRRRRSARMAL
jgi:hypothetical protein